MIRSNNSNDYSDYTKCIANNQSIPNAFWMRPADKKARYIGYLAAGQTTGIIIGPVIGGLLLDGFTWGGITLSGSIYLPFYLVV